MNDEENFTHEINNLGNPPDLSRIVNTLNYSKCQYDIMLQKFEDFYKTLL